MRVVGFAVLIVAAVGSHKAIAAATMWEEALLPAMRARDRAEILRLGGRVLPSRGAWLQATPSDCGVAVVREAVRQTAGGRVPSRDSVAVLAQATAGGTTIEGLGRALHVLGVLARRGDQIIVLNADQLYIAHLRIGHFVLVRQVANDTVRMFDPLTGEVELGFQAFRTLWSGVGLLVEGQAGLAQSRARTSAGAGRRSLSGG